MPSDFKSNILSYYDCVPFRGYYIKQPTIYTHSLIMKHKYLFQESRHLFLNCCLQILINVSFSYYLWNKKKKSENSFLLLCPLCPKLFSFNIIDYEPLKCPIGIVDIGSCSCKCLLYNPRCKGTDSI